MMFINSGCRQQRKRYAGDAGYENKGRSGGLNCLFALGSVEDRETFSPCRLVRGMPLSAFPLQIGSISHERTRIICRGTRAIMRVCIGGCKDYDLPEPLRATHMPRSFGLDHADDPYRHLCSEG